MSDFQHIHDKLACFNQDVAFQVNLDSQVMSKFQAEVQMHIASAYKVLVAVACTQAIAENRFEWSTPLLLTSQERVPDSPITDSHPDGETMTIAELMHAMIAVSDNTATEMLQSYLGLQAFTSVLQAYQLSQTQVPPSLRHYHELAEQGVAATHSIAALSSAGDLVRCYECALEDSRFPSSESIRFRETMRAEDKQQQKVWGESIICYRKSGYLEIAPFYAMALAGKLVSPQHHFTFAFIYNTEQKNHKEAELKLIAFQRSLKQILNQLNAYLVDLEIGSDRFNPIVH
jgi:hypothetical protein